METEYYSMRLTAEAFGYDLSLLPQQVRDVSLTEHDAALSAEEKKTLAREIIFDDLYHQEKDLIFKNTQECLYQLMSNVKVNMDRNMQTLSGLFRMQWFFIILLIAVVLAFVALATAQVIGPLVRAVPRIREDKPIPISGASEFRFLASTYNQMHRDNRESKELLAYEAAHDRLTGVLNRKGFEKKLAEKRQDSLALLLIDVDEFKSVNDMYGHDVGDHVLIRITKALRDSFRSGDMLCRMGGDEFLLLLTDINSEKKDLLRKKIKSIHDILNKPEGDTPPVTVSVGIAFSQGVFDETLYRKADKALYEVKNKGRGGCAFYE